MTRRLDKPGEISRRRIVNLVLVFLWLLVFEGVLRKWVFPSLNFVLYFVRDPVVLAIYIIALTSGRTGLRNSVALFAGVVSIVILAVVFTQNLEVSNQDKLLLAAYGLRNYLFYIPLLFVIGVNFEPEDFDRLARHVSIILVVVAPLVIAQFFSPYDSPLNRGRDDANIHNLWGGFGRIRPTGTFTNVRGQEHLIGSSMALLMSAWIVRRRQRILPGTMLLLGTCSALVCLAFSSSRGMLILSCLVLASCIAFAVVTRIDAMRWRALFVPACIFVVSAIVIPVAFPEAIESFLGRWTNASKTELSKFEFGLVGRVLYEFKDFGRLMSLVPLVGYGIGLGGNAGTRLGQTIDGKMPLELAETDYARHMIDIGPIAGILYIVFRATLVIYIGWKSYTASRASAHPMPILLFGYVGIVLLNQQITGHGSINAFAWLYGGLALAAAKSYRRAFVVGSNLTQRTKMQRTQAPSPLGMDIRTGR